MVVVLGMFVGACHGSSMLATRDGSTVPGCTGPGCGSTGALCSSDGDCTTGLVCDLTAYQCVQCRSQRDCLDTEYCKAGICAADVCVQNTSTCTGNAIVTCLSDGSGIGSTVPCGVRQTCAMQGTTPACTNWICTPAAKSCQVGAETVVTCDTDGLHQTPAEDCGAKSQVCEAAACMPVACAAGARFCSGSEVRLCSAKGASSTLSSTCSTSQYCDNVTATCKAQLCSPNQPACNEHMATTCNADGSGYASGGLDCSTSSQICVAGVCQSLACVPSAKFCSAGTVKLCSADGMTSSLYQTCLSTQYCDSTTAACKAQLCTPSQPACNTTTATTCNTDGSGYQAGGVDCSTSGQVCVSGTCKALACVPSAKFCSAGTVKQCSTDGMTSSLYQTCVSTQYCDTTTATCKAQLCTPNQPACNANSTTLCNTDGSGYAGTAQSCGALYCVAGKCQVGMFREDFEDGDFAGWQVGSTLYTRSVTTSTAAAGTSHSLVQTGGGTHQTGLYYTFPNVKPTHVGWWSMSTSTSTNNAYFVLSSGSLSNYMAWVYMRTTGYIRLYDTDTQLADVSYLANVWYHMELRNINWTTKVFDFYINDVLVTAGFSFRSSTAVDITRLDLYNFDVGGTAYWDEIVFD
jgi:hypothetical protein